MPEVPVEPALLGAGLVWLSDSWSVWNSVVLIATRSLHQGIQTESSRRNRCSRRGRESGRE
ncbi:hypothetical protein PDIG_22860 [Penicillium digitatum PHI26]|uniref:Uncharacterized protein n=2 Tax=Penicillium digitatum TaxID=36651 RepID=K9GS87_PEND2|nr:hypothetical protein PDIP_15260 [Penicillium digitatum Pd1]EKV15931.1 hypothetical protein PDIG_22860 [Penicillium digitatum PHI26]EKV20552.1 hypothetical protein PDIP_15260 [Penicillium digitatum Pd1]